jgi:predicted GH43/DUF377 family glycosyl hydrolase
MSKYKMISEPLKNIPWQEGPEKFDGAPVWRYKENPIINRNPIPGVARIFNSAVMPYEGKFIGVFRGEQTNGIPYIYLGHSEDAIHWDFETNKIPFVDKDGNPFMPRYAYDDMSYARGTDSKGRYTSRDSGYSGMNDAIMELREAMNKATDETSRMKIKQLSDEMERM